MNITPIRDELIAFAENKGMVGMVPILNECQSAFELWLAGNILADSDDITVEERNYVNELLDLLAAGDARVGRVG